MEQSTAARRLVKSPPELWAVLSSEVSLGRHLAEFGEIRITRVDPETTVAWEGDRVSGTVELAPTGWGTKVILTATPVPHPPGVQSPGDDPPAAARTDLRAAPQGASEEPPAARTTEAIAPDEPPQAAGAPAAAPPELAAAAGPLVAAARPEPAAAAGTPAAAPPEPPDAEIEKVAPAAVPEPIPPQSQVDPVAAKRPREKRRGFLAWLFRRRRRSSAWAIAAPVPASTATPAPASTSTLVPAPASSRAPASASAATPASPPPVPPPASSIPAPVPPPASSIPAPLPPTPDPSPPTPAPDPGPLPPGPDPMPPAPTPPDPVPPTPAPQPPAPPSIEALPIIVARRLAPAPALDHARTVAILTDVLDDLGADHHRPFRRD